MSPTPQKRVVKMGPRPRAKTPPGASSKAAANSSQLQKHTVKKEVEKVKDSDEETSDWDDIRYVLCH